MLFYQFNELHEAAQRVALSNFMATLDDDLANIVEAREELERDTSKIYNMFGQEKTEHSFEAAKASDRWKK